MSDDVTRLLGRFTPEGGVDRDELMFQAGRASVPSPARWQALSGLLALSQALTLFLFLAQPTSLPTPAPPDEPTIAPASPSPMEGWTVGHDPFGSVDEFPPLEGETNLIPDRPPLRIHSSLDSLSLN